MLNLLSGKVGDLFERPKSEVHSGPCSNTRKVSLVLKPILYEEIKDECPMSPEANDSKAFALECLRDAQNLKRKEENHLKVGVSETGTSKVLNFDHLRLGGSKHNTSK
jgi:hypothetical protein